MNRARIVADQRHMQEARPLRPHSALQVCMSPQAAQQGAAACAGTSTPAHLGPIKVVMFVPSLRRFQLHAVLGFVTFLTIRPGISALVRVVITSLPSRMSVRGCQPSVHFQLRPGIPCRKLDPRSLQG